MNPHARTLASCPAFSPQKAFQAWLEAKRRDQQQQRQRQRHLVQLSVMAPTSWESDSEVARKERHWQGNFGMPASKSPTFGAAKPLVFGMESPQGQTHMLSTAHRTGRSLGGS